MKNLKKIICILVNIIIFVNIVHAKHEQIETFEQFKEVFHKHYHSEVEEAAARQNFLKTKRWIDENKHKYGFQIGITFFADEPELDENERKQLSLPMTSEHKSDTHIKDNSIVDFNSLPKHFDWRDHIEMSPIISQGKCGSCWAFVAAVTMEANLAIHRNLTVVLSKQELIDCSILEVKTNHKCNGGHTFHGWLYAHRNGVHLEKDYPLINYGNNIQFHECNRNLTGETYSVGNYYDMTPNSTDNNIKAAILKYGPISVRVESHEKLFRLYKGGILKNIASNPASHNHVIVVLGWGYDAEENLEYWIIRNSWGKMWGENGFGRIQAGINSLGINDYPSFLL